QDRPDQAEEAREGEVGLCLDACGRQHDHSVGLVDGMVEEGGLADPRLASHDDGAALACARPVEQLVDERGLAVASDETDRDVGSRAPGWGTVRGLERRWLRHSDLPKRHLHAYLQRPRSAPQRVVADHGPGTGDSTGDVTDATVTHRRASSNSMRIEVKR